MIIAVCGTDGAGKSTQINNLIKNNKDRFNKVEVLDKWSILEKSEFPECRFIETKLDDLRVDISHMEGYSRILFLFWSIYITMSKKDLYDKNSLFILDGYWMKHAASEIIYGCNEKVVDDLTKVFPEPDMTLYINTPIEETVKRKKGDFTPYECGRDDQMKIENFITHQKKLKALMDQWSKNYNWQIIDGFTNKELISNAIDDLVNEKRKFE